MLKENFTLNDLPNDTLRSIYRYWLDIKGDRLMPSRADLNPADIVELLPCLCLLDVENGGNRYRMRLIGSDTVKAMNIDATGKYLDEFPFVEQILKSKYDWLVEKRRPYFHFDKLRWSSKSYMDYYAVGLPLSSNGTDVDILMFGTYYLFPEETRARFHKLGA